MILPSIRVCLVGAGRVARVHGNTFTRYLPDCALVAIADPILETRHATANQLDITEQDSSLAEALDNTNFDVVIITTHTHADLVIEAAQAGKPIFLEERPVYLSEIL